MRTIVYALSIATVAAQGGVVCQCFANGQVNEAFCERGAFPDAASCNANPRCHWGPEENSSCRVGDPTPTPDPTATPPAVIAPSPPSPAPTVVNRNCDSNPAMHMCTDGTWRNGHGHTCADLRRNNNGAPDWTDTAGRSAGMQCCQYCLAPAPSPPTPSPPAPAASRPSWCRYYPTASACQMQPPRPSWCRWAPYHPACYGQASEDTVAKKTVSNGGEALLPTKIN